MFDDEIDPTTVPADFVDLSKTLLDDAAPVAEVAPVVAEPIKASRYAGKTSAELEQMLEDAQAHIGRQSSEIGEVRKLADALVQKSLTTPVGKVPAEVKPEEFDASDFFADPQAAIARAVSNHPSVVSARETAERLNRDRSAAAVQAKHPDMQEVLATPEFSAWVKASPMRTKMYAMADQQWDIDAADELLNSFKSSANFKATSTVATEAAQKAGKAAIDAALKAGGVGTSNGNSGVAPAKKYRRSDIMRLMTTDPRRYESMADEILLAYSEGRVV